MFVGYFVSAMKKITETLSFHEPITLVGTLVALLPVATPSCHLALYLSLSLSSFSVRLLCHHIAPACLFIVYTSDYILLPRSELFSDSLLVSHLIQPNLCAHVPQPQGCPSFLLGLVSFVPFLKPHPRRMEMIPILPLQISSQWLSFVNSSRHGGA